MPRRPLLSLVLSIAALLVGCLPDEAPRGLRPSPGGSGPRVIFQLDTRPLPDIPFPNDLLARPDPDSPTGLRLNLAVLAPSTAERRLRQAALDLDGFGTSGTIHVRFDAPLDLVALSGVGRDPADDPILVVDVSEGPTFGERIPLDLGRGHFPVEHADPSAVAFARDPRAEAGNLVFETVDEDLDGDGVLDPGEDTDGDGVLDRSNLSPDGRPMTFYERATNTLLLRPIVPLRPGRRYAVVLTDRVVGLDGAPVRSPFPFIHHIQHADALARLPEALTPHGVALNDVGYVWAFTTQNATRDLEALRAGLYGWGPFDWLSRCVPDGLIESSDPDVLVLPGEALAGIGARVGDDVVDAARIEADWRAVGQLVAGSVGVPYLLDDRDQGGPTRLAALGAVRLDDAGCLQRLGDIRSGLRRVPGDDDETWRVDVDRGTLSAVLAEVPFWCTVPRRGDATTPAPVVLWAHDVGGSRLDALRYAGRFARWGLATCALDAVGHGAVGVEPLGVEPFDAVLARHRARDLDGDGVADPGVDTFTADALHTRDVIRQSALDWLQLIRVLRSFDGRTWRTRPAVRSGIAGDFDDDGEVDLGGPDAAFHMGGVGYGGTLAAIVAGLEPAITSVAPVSPAAGLTDTFIRSAHPSITAGVILPTLGPLVVGLPEIGPGGQDRRGTLVSVWTPALDRVAHADPEARLGIPVLQLPPLAAGQTVVLTNVDTGQRTVTRAAPDGGFRLAIGTDALLGSDRLAHLAAGLSTTGLGDRIRLELPGLDPPTQVSFDYAVELMSALYPPQSPLVALGSGWAVDRQSPAFRRFTQILQTVLEPADPLNYARRLFTEPTGAVGGGAPGADLLLLATAGDPLMPIAGALSLGRAAGLWPVGGAVDALLLEAGVVEGLPDRAPLLDVDLLPGTTIGERVWDPPLRHTLAAGERGESALRIAHLDPLGAHGPGDNTALIELIARFFATGDTAADPCLATADCPGAPPAPRVDLPPVEPEPPQGE